MKDKGLEGVVEIKVDRHEKEGKMEYMVCYRMGDKISSNPFLYCDFIPNREEHKAIVREILLATVEKICPC